MATPGNQLIENNQPPYARLNGGIRTELPVYVGSDLTVTGLIGSATTDSVTADPTTDAPAGWLKLTVAGAARYLPFYTLTGS